MRHHISFLGDNTLHAGVRVRLGAITLAIGMRVLLPLRGVIARRNPHANGNQTYRSSTTRRYTPNVVPA